MSQIAIEVKDLSKMYNIGHERKGMKGTATLRDALTNFVRKPTELLTGHRLRKEHFWALKDINFQINQGDVVGIIGKNGSGKSTLLKILSQIVEPTTGEIHLRGKVASLLEVGTGFHPELTGRENIFFNGAILGMKRREIFAKFDDIVAFSEVEQFLDTPVKFYSSGMYVRLAFAVAAHLDPDILIVDEVLAVGDAAFQKKSLGKMKSVAASGRTVLFVSHSMDSVARLCNRGILLANGQIKYMGTADSAIRKYSAMQKSSSPVVDLTSGEVDGSRLRKLTINNSRSQPDLVIKTLEPFSVTIEFEVAQKDDGKPIVCAMGLQSATGNPVRTAWPHEEKLEAGRYMASFVYDDVFLEAGDYNIIASLTIDGKNVQYVDEAANFTIEEVAPDKSNVNVQRLSGNGVILNQPKIKIEAA
jgi:lipopolysaccharide transport system ATP-binding protein